MKPRCAACDDTHCIFVKPRDGYLRRAHCRHCPVPCHLCAESEPVGAADVEVRELQLEELKAGMPVWLDDKGWGIVVRAYPPEPPEHEAGALTVELGDMHYTQSQAQRGTNASYLVKLEYFLMDEP